MQSIQAGAPGPVAEDGPPQIPFRSGFVAVLGRPNVGKSTLLNALLGTKVSIVSPKPQTTRHRIQGVLTLPTAQVVLVDTPGLGGQASGPLLRALHRSAGAAAADADVGLVVAAVRCGPPQLDEVDHAVLRAAQRGGGPLVVALNKIDLLESPAALLPWMRLFGEAAPVRAIVPISAQRRQGLGALQQQVVEALPPGAALFPDDCLTDQPERSLCAELVREQLLFHTQQEVPHSAVVVVDRFEDGRGAGGAALCRLEGRIVVERASQKAIVIGRGGQQIRAIGTAARQRIETLLGCQVHLRMTVHVDPRWTRSDDAVRRYGLAGGSQ